MPRRLDIALLAPIAWLVLIPGMTLLRSAGLAVADDPIEAQHVYRGTAKVDLFFSIALANLAFIGLQAWLSSVRFRGLRMAVVRRFHLPGQTTAETAARDNRWFWGLAIVAFGLAALHLALMPRIPVISLLLDPTNSTALSLDREYAAKLLPVPTILKYLFTWNSRVLLPVLLCLAVLSRRRWRIAAVAAFGLFYIVAPLEKFPSMLFVLAPFLALAVQRGKRIYAPIVIAGALLSIVPAWVVNQGAHLSVGVHETLHIPIAHEASLPAPPVEGGPSGTGDTGPPPDLGSTPPTAAFHMADITGSLKTLILRRIGTGPADVTYTWYLYFPDHHPYLYGAGWNGLAILSGTRVNPANLVGRWAYFGRDGYNISSITAYGSMVADGWAEFGYVGVIIECLVLALIATALELIRGFTLRPFCLACYAPALGLIAVQPPQGGMFALLLSLGGFLFPLLGLAYLWSGVNWQHTPAPEVAPAAR